MKKIAFLVFMALVSVMVCTGCKEKGGEQAPAPEVSTNAPAAGGTNAPAQ